MDKAKLAKLRAMGFEFDSAYDDAAERIEKSRADDIENKKKREKAKLKAESEKKQSVSQEEVNTPGKNGRPVALYFEKVPALLTGGWERSISAFLNVNGNKYATTHIRGLHCAIDIAYTNIAAGRVPVYATHSGKFKKDIDDTVYLTEGVFRSVYAHMINIPILKSVDVSAGDLIGYVGAKNSDNVHLHYEIQFNIPELSKRPNTGEYGVFNGGKIRNDKTWKSINPFIYEGTPTIDGQPLGRAIPGVLDFSTFVEYFVNIQQLIFKELEFRNDIDSFYEYVISKKAPRCEALLNWLKANGL